MSYGLHRTAKPEFKSYKDAKAFLDAGKTEESRHRRKLEYETYIQLKANGDICITLWCTEVVTYRPDGSCVLNSGGWRTPTTKDRINRYGPVGVWQDRGVWYLPGSVVFEDGITIGPRGGIRKAGSKTQDAKVRVMTKRIKEYVDGYLDAFWAGKVPAPSGGDCWHCAMRSTEAHGKNPVTMGDLAGNGDHILSHFRESYYVPSLLVNAMDSFGASLFSKAVVGKVFSGEPVESFERGISEDMIRRALTRYLKRCLKIAQ